MEYRGLLYHKYELASLRPGNDDELLHADGGACLSQLRLCGSGHRLGDCSDSRRRAPRIEDHWQLLGRPDALFSVGAPARMPDYFAGFRVARRGAKSETLCQCPTDRPANGANT